MKINKYIENFLRLLKAIPEIIGESIGKIIGGLFWIYLVCLAFVVIVAVADTMSRVPWFWVLSPIWGSLGLYVVLLLVASLADILDVYKNPSPRPIVAAEIQSGKIHTVGTVPRMPNLRMLTNIDTLKDIARTFILLWVPVAFSFILFVAWFLGKVEPWDVCVLPAFGSLHVPTHIWVLSPIWGALGLYLVAGVISAIAEWSGMGFFEKTHEKGPV